MGVGPDIVIPGSPAGGCAIGFHPARRTPGAGKKKEAGIDLLDLPQRRHDIGFIMLQAEVVQVHIVGNVVIAIDAARVVAGADATAAQVQIQPLGRINFAQKRLTGSGRHAVQQEAGGIRKRSSKAEDGLKLACAIDLDGGRASPGGGRGPTQLRTLGVLLLCIGNIKSCRPVRQRLGF